MQTMRNGQMSRPKQSCDRHLNRTRRKIGFVRRGADDYHHVDNAFDWHTKTRVQLNRNLLDWFCLVEWFFVVFFASMSVMFRCERSLKRIKRTEGGVWAYVEMRTEKMLDGISTKIFVWCAFLVSTSAASPTAKSHCCFGWFWFPEENVIDRQHYCGQRNTNEISANGQYSKCFRCFVCFVCFNSFDCFFARWIFVWWFWHFFIFPRCYSYVDNQQKISQNFHFSLLDLPQRKSNENNFNFDVLLTITDNKLNEMKCRRWNTKLGFLCSRRHSESVASVVA